MSFTPLVSRRKTAKPSRRYLKIAIIIGIALGLLFFRHAQYTKAIRSGFDPSDTKVRLILIQKGDSAKKVGEVLEEKEIIKKSSYLTSYLRDQNQEDKVLAGRFELSPAMSISQIVEVITDSKKAKNYLTIPEGYTIQQIDDRLTEQGLIQSGGFIDAVKKFAQWDEYPFLPKQEMMATALPLEGFLFPDTYKIDTEGFSSEGLIAQMLDNFERRLPADITAQLSAKNISLFELVMTASMLEKEVRHDEDLPIVAGIIWKRVQSDWLLNIDATLIYDLKRQHLTKVDLQEDSPYNTYTRKGFPPGPIGNPGIKMILASLNPQKTSHWFYITDPKSGKAIFADTNDQQNRNRAIYLQ